METIEAGIIDLILVLLLVLLAGSSLLLPRLFRAVIAFIGFGLIMAVVWIRLHAVDIALAEAMIGSGVTGALFLAALARMNRSGNERESATTHRTSGARAICLNSNGRVIGNGIQWRGVIATAVIILAMMLMALMVFPLPEPDGKISALVFRNLSDSGVSNPVTAVLLNFRAYDTLLEIGVVLLTLLGLSAVVNRDRLVGPRYTDRVLSGFYRLTLPLLILFCAYMVWVGKYEPGGAFQAAALLAAGGILGHIIGANPRPHNWDGKHLRIAVSSGFAVFLSIGVLLWVQNGLFLRFVPESAGGFILGIEVVATIAISISLVILFHGSSGHPSSFLGNRQLPPAAKEAE
jgi:multisubunit Na+/H+ antiporter MnhB subunit